MIFPEKLLLLRKNTGLTQEELAEKISVSRQAIAKWESGQAYPDISNLIRISGFFKTTIDHLVRDNDSCITSLVTQDSCNSKEIIDFLS
jgi:transcriptional regulator with XRE-family HTH domain